MIMVCQYRFLNCNKCNTLVGDIDTEGDYACVGTGKFEKSLYFSLHFAWKFKLF